MRKIALVLLMVFSLPILLHVYQPSMELGGWGLMLGAIGYFVSPALLFGTMLYAIKKSWR